MIKKTFILLFLFFACSDAFAQTGNISTTDLSSNFFKTTQGLSMGGAYRALADSTQAILYNPAGMSQRKNAMMVSGDYAYFKDPGSHFFGIGVVDAQTSEDVAYGLSYHQSRPSFGGVSAKVHQVMIAISHQTGPLMAGGTVKGYWINIDNPSIEGPKGVDLDLSLMFKPSDMFSIAVIGYNVVRGHQIEEYPFQMAVAGAITLIPQATFTLDMVKNFNTLSDENVNIHFGGQFRVSEQVQLRGGYAKDRIFNNDYYGLGLSFLAPQANLHFSFGQSLDPRSEIYSVSLEYRM